MTIPQRRRTTTRPQKPKRRRRKTDTKRSYYPPLRRHVMTIGDVTWMWQPRNSQVDLALTAKRSNKHFSSTYTKKVVATVVGILLLVLEVLLTVVMFPIKLLISTIFTALSITEDTQRHRRPLEDPEYTDHGASPGSSSTLKSSKGQVQREAIGESSSEDDGDTETSPSTETRQSSAYASGDSDIKLQFADVWRDLSSTSLNAVCRYLKEEQAFNPCETDIPGIFLITSNPEIIIISEESDSSTTASEYKYDLDTTESDRSSKERVRFEKQPDVRFNEDWIECKSQPSSETQQKVYEREIVSDQTAAEVAKPAADDQCHDQQPPNGKVAIESESDKKQSETGPVKAAASERGASKHDEAKLSASILKKIACFERRALNHDEVKGTVSRESDKSGSVSKKPASSGSESSKHGGVKRSASHESKTSGSSVTSLEAKDGCNKSSVSKSSTSLKNKDSKSSASLKNKDSKSIASSKNEDSESIDSMKSKDSKSIASSKSKDSISIVSSKSKDSKSIASSRSDDSNESKSSPSSFEKDQLAATKEASKEPVQENHGTDKDSKKEMASNSDKNSEDDIRREVTRLHKKWGGTPVEQELETELRRLHNKWSNKPHRKYDDGGDKSANAFTEDRPAVVTLEPSKRRVQDNSAGESKKGDKRRC